MTVIDESISPVTNTSVSAEEVNGQAAPQSVAQEISSVEPAPEISAEEPTANTTESQPAKPSVEELTRQLAEATQKATTYWDNLLRQRAEMENSRKRADRDLENARKYALEKFATELLPVKDSMEAGLEVASKPESDLNSIREGLGLTSKILGDVLQKFGIVEINPLNEKFDPQWHEAMTMQPVPNVAEGTVIYVHQKGYKLNERLLRPARVIVAQALLSANQSEKPLEN